MTDTTRPGEFADIVADDEKFRWYVVTKLERHDAAIKELRQTMTGVKSSADDYADTAAQVKGGWRVLVGLTIFGAAVYGILQAVSWFIEKLIKP